MSGLPGDAKPWHMWGDTATLRVNHLGLSLSEANEIQFARINYGRPETWSFFLFAKLLDGPVATLGPADVYVRIDVFPGVGRASMGTLGSRASISESFVTFAFRVPVGLRPGNQPANVKYVTSVQSPLVNDLVATSGRPIDWLVAQDLQCSARLQVEAVSDAGEYIAEAGCFFAPRTHVRPDWFRAAPENVQFPGGEVNGS